MRDLKADLEICEKATPGPWEELNDNPIDTYWAEKHPEDFAFIAAAREGWPEAIERAIAAEEDAQNNYKISQTLLKRIKEAEKELFICKTAIEIACGIITDEGSLPCSPDDLMEMAKGHGQQGGVKNE